jgi:hypothetical protein
MINILRICTTILIIISITILTIGIVSSNDNMIIGGVICFIGSGGILLSLIIYNRINEEVKSITEVITVNQV